MSEAWFDRLVIEHAQLTDKIKDLRAYVSNGMPGASIAQQNLMIGQLASMIAYSSILNARIKVE